MAERRAWLGGYSALSERVLDAAQRDLVVTVDALGVDAQLEEFGVGPIVAATVLCAWSHPGRIHSEAAFAMLAGVAPIPANSGQVTTRYRLNRYGDRHLNNALHTVAQSRIGQSGFLHRGLRPHRALGAERRAVHGHGLLLLVRHRSQGR